MLNVQFLAGQIFIKVFFCQCQTPSEKVCDCWKVPALLVQRFSAEAEEVQAQHQGPHRHQEVPEIHVPANLKNRRQI